VKAILVLDEMPDNCSECPLVEENEYCASWCKYNQEVCIEPYLKRNNNCPLKLIDNEGDNNEN